MRKGSFSVEKVTSFTIDHNTRKSKPRYLIGLENRDNIYEEYYTYDDFQELAEKRYQEVVKQKMQKSQKENLFEEAVISLEEHHTIDDVKNLFKELKKEFTGHTLINLAIHNDEGHFEKNGIEYYPTKHILKKDDGWYILDEDNLDQIEDLEKPKNEDFKIKVDINDFKRVYNYHAHAVFSKFDLDIGKSARMQKKDMSHRYKFVTETLGMKYEPDNKTRHKKKSIGDHKEQKSKIRNEKLKLVKQIDQEKDKNQKLEQELEQLKQNQDKKDLAKQQDLKEEIARLRAELKQNGAVRSDYAQLEQLNKDLKQQIKDKTLTISDLQDKIKGLETQLLEEKKEKEHFKSLVEVKEIEIVELENQNKSLQEQKTSLEEQILELGKKINSSPIMKEYEHKIKEYEKQIEDYDNTFTKLDEILLTDEEKKQDKYLTTSETVQRVSRVKKENTWFKARFKELNELLKAPIKLNIEDLLKEPMKIYTDIFKAVSDKIRFGVEDTKKFFDNLKETSKEINKQLSSSSNPGTKKNEDLDTPNSSNPFKRKFKRNRDN